jgi:hypothetical protein
MSDAEFSPWKARFDKVIERMQTSGEMEIDRVLVRVNPPDIHTFIAEVVRRAANGSIKAVYRVWSADQTRVMGEFPYDRIVPAAVLDDATGEMVPVSSTKMFLSSGLKDSLQ